MWHLAVGRSLLHVENRMPCVSCWGWPQGQDPVLGRGILGTLVMVFLCLATTTARAGAAVPAQRAQDEAASADCGGAAGRGGHAARGAVGAAGPGEDPAAAAVCCGATDQLHQPDLGQVQHRRTQSWSLGTFGVGSLWATAPLWYFSRVLDVPPSEAHQGCT